MYHREYETLKKIDAYCGPNSELERKSEYTDDIFLL